MLKLHGEENCHGIVKFRGKYVLAYLNYQKLLGKFSIKHLNLETI